MYNTATFARMFGVLVISSFAYSDPHLRSLSASDPSGGHWSLSAVALAFIASGLLLSLYGRYLLKVTLMLTGAIFGWLIFEQIAYRASIDNGGE
jgi:hypothetical protein